MVNVANRSTQRRTRRTCLVNTSKRNKLIKNKEKQIFALWQVFRAQTERLLLFFLLFFIKIVDLYFELTLD